MNQQSFFQDVVDFHEKFKIDLPVCPQPLKRDLYDFRVKFMFEELIEFVEAWALADLAQQADALVDLVYVVLGTAAMMGIPFEECWREVHDANMAKRLSNSNDPNRRHKLDIVKPVGWEPPDIRTILNRYLPESE
jgi:predicted HAD superfamily Cof-like phosphohydrolase